MNDDLRRIAREVAQELLAGNARDVSPLEPQFDVDASTDVIRIESDADLDGFVRRLVTLLENPKVRRDIKTGKRRFRLRPTSAASAPGQAVTFSQGLVNERDVLGVAEQTDTVILAKRARMTPLARDAAKHAGIAIIREPA